METYMVGACLALLGAVVLTLVFIIYFVCTKNRKLYKSFDDPTSTEGTVTDISSDECGRDYTTFYTVTYTFSDDYGYRHTARFRATRHPFRVGDRIDVQYDLKNPQRCITEFQLKSSKGMWWKVPLILAAMIIPAIIIAAKVN